MVDRIMEDAENDANGKRCCKRSPTNSRWAVVVISRCPKTDVGHTPLGHRPNITVA